MIRAHLYHKQSTADHHFRWRGGEISRLEAFADGIFAITVTLLIVANTSSNYGFYDLWLMVRDLPAFLASFAFIAYAWFEHYLFFRRYGLADGQTILLNAQFLFLVMVLAYPLKLLTTFLWYLIIGVSTDSLFVFPNDVDVLNDLLQRKYMMYFYGAGILGVFGTLFLMHVNAYKKRKILELDQIETTITIRSIMHNLATVIIAVASILILFFTQNPGISGIVYFLMPLSHPIIGIIFDKKVKKLLSQNA